MSLLRTRETRLGPGVIFNFKLQYWRVDPTRPQTQLAFFTRRDPKRLVLLVVLVEVIRTIIMIHVYDPGAVTIFAASLLSHRHPTHTSFLRWWSVCLLRGGVNDLDIC